MSTAVVTGASRGLGLALARALAERGWRLVIDARGAGELEEARRELAALTEVVAVCGDVSDDWHRGALIAATEGRLDLLVNNASVLGPSPLPPLASLDAPAFEDVLRVNAVAPLALIQLALAAMPAGGRILNISSDAALEAYEGWGGYGARRPRSTSSRSCLPPSAPTCTCTPSIPVTCARACTRTRSPARTSPIARRPRRAFPACWR